MVDRPVVDRILVPFAPEARASRVGDTDFMEAFWYRRKKTVPGDWSGWMLLHFGAVDHDAMVWVVGHEAGRHRGGFASFSFDVTQHTRPGAEVPLVLRAR